MTLGLASQPRSLAALWPLLNGDRRIFIQLIHSLQPDASSSITRCSSSTRSPENKNNSLTRLHRRSQIIQLCVICRFINLVQFCVHGWSIRVFNDFKEASDVLSIFQKQQIIHFFETTNAKAQGLLLWRL